MLLFLLAPGVAAKDEATAYRWRSVAIGGGGFVTGVVFHPAEKGLAYARTDVGGAYRWDAQAQRWMALTDWLGREDNNLLGIESLAVDPADPERVYLAAGTYKKAGNGAILRSLDRGRTFSRADLPFPLGGNEMGRGNGERLAVDPNDGRVLFFGSRGAGLWRSQDGGANWSQMKSFPAAATADTAGVQTSWAGLQAVGIVFVQFDPASGRRGEPTPKLYAGVSTRQASLYESSDGGGSWKPVARQPVGLRPNHMARASSGVYYLSYGDEPGPNTMNNGAVWKYAPASGEWTDITPAPQTIDTEGDGFGWGAVAVDPRNPEVLLATTFCRYGPSDDIFRSVDGGRHWQALFPRSKFDHSVSPWTAHTGPHWMADVKINPFDADEALFVTGYGIWASRNLTAFDEGGSVVQWWFKNAGLEETVPLALSSPPEGAHLLSGVGDIDGFRHDDLGKPVLQFAGPRLTNTESIAYAGQAPQVAVRSGRIRDRRNDEVRAAYSLDGGASWRAFAHEPPQGEGAGRIVVAADGKRVIWTPAKSDAHWITADFGQHWQAVKGLPKTAVLAADRMDEGIYYGFDAATGKFYVSGNGGVEFKEASAGTGEIGDWYRAELQPSPTQSAVVYVAASWRGLLRWSPGKLEKLPGVDNAYSVGLGKPREGGSTPALYLYGQVSGRTGLFRSDDEGRKWIRIDDDAHRYGGIGNVTGDPRLYGRVYFTTGGRGIIYGDQVGEEP
ncbi:MAG: cellulase [Pseudoxanthomonas sp.]